MSEAIRGYRVRPVGEYWYVTMSPMERYFRRHRDGFVEDYKPQPHEVGLRWEVAR